MITSAKGITPQLTTKKVNKMTLFAHVIDGLIESTSMNNLDHWFDGFSDASDALEVHSEGFEGETGEEEMTATVKALNEMFKHGVDSIENSHAQSIIEEWNIAVWGQDFVHNGLSVAFAG